MVMRHETAFMQTLNAITCNQDVVMFVDHNDMLANLY